jgi:GxxExxY protein
MEPNDLPRQIISAAMEVHSTLGPGLLESAYRACLRHELKLRSLESQSEMPLPVTYKGLTLDVAYRLDLLVENVVVVEVKAVSKTTEVHAAQLLSYMRLNRRPVGLLINFHVKHLHQGVTRMVNRFRE